MPRRRTLLILLAILAAALLWLYDQGGGPLLRPPGAAESAAEEGRGEPSSRSEDGQASAQRGSLADRSGYRRGASSAGRLRVFGSVRGPEGELLGGLSLLLVPVSPQFEYQVPRALDLLAQEGGQELPLQLRQQLDRRLPLQTAADGSYQFQLPAEFPLGVLVAQRPGFAPDWGSLDKELAKWRRQMGFDEQAWPRELRFDLQLQPEGRISGRVTERSSGSPAQGAAVEIFEASSARRIEAGGKWVVSGEPLKVALADARGRYGFSGLPPGVYALSAAPGPTAYAVGTADSRRVRLEAGQYLSDVDFSIEAGGTLVVRVTDHSSQPIRGATCAVTPTTERLGPRSLETQALGLGRYGQDSSDAAGRCFLKGLWLGRSYNLLVFHKDLFARAQEEFEIPSDVGRTEVEVKLWRRSMIAGWTVVGSGEPLGDVMVGLKSLHSSGDDAIAVGLRSDEDGAFAFQGLPPGQYRLESNAAGTVALEISLGPGQVEDDLELVVADQWTSLSGWVSDDRGRPLPGASVEIRAPYGQGKKIAVETDSQGRFSEDRLIGDTFDVTASHPEHQHETLRRVDAGRSDLNLVLKRQALVEGRLVDSQGRPITKEGVPIFAAQPYDRPSQGVSTTTREVGVSDDRGRFTLRLLPGKGYLLARTSGYAAGRSSEFQLAPGESVRGLDIVLPQEAQVKGRVVDARGQPVQGAEAVAYEVSKPQAHGRQLPTARLLPGVTGFASSDLQGRFRIDGLPKQNCRITARHPDWASSSTLIVDLSDAKEDPVDVGDLRLRQAGVVEGVLIAEGKPLAHWPITLAAHDYHQERSATDAQGRFHYQEVTPGTVILSAQKGSLAGERRLTLDEGGTLEVRLQLEPKAVIRVKASDLEAGQVYGVEALRQRQPGDPLPSGFFFRTDHQAAPDGTLDLRVEAGVPGEYRVSLFQIRRQGGARIREELGPVICRVRTTLHSGEQELVLKPNSP
ncbi:MAG TPA: carboxypeptidase-like regulatory domain-containing protein [Acidobacteriota bacterium]|nr:carboxypeptidase-like regulatory domain-containing protein [Acidobacteriota bacterium]